MKAPHAHRLDARTLFLYVLAILREFRLTIAFVVVSVLAGALVFWNSTEDPKLLHPLMPFHAAWQALLNQDNDYPRTWSVVLVDGLYPVAGFAVFGEGFVRFMALVSSARRGGKEWMTVKASTYRDHVVLCGLGHVGHRVLQRFLEEGLPVVALDRDEQGRFVGAARAAGVPILVRDVRDDAALTDAGVPHAKVIVIATDDDLANLEVALDARRMNPRIRIVMRLFDQQTAVKLKAAGIVDEAFSTSALAAPVVAELAAKGFRVSTSAAGAALPGPTPQR
jgi:voltage-gated potassium channel Kch